MTLTLLPHSRELLPWAPADAGVKLVHDYEATVPPPLTSQRLHIDADTASLCQEARLALAILDRSPVMHRPGVAGTLTVAEAIASSLVDGHIATSKQLAAAMGQQSTTRSARAIHQAATNLAAHVDASRRAVTLGSLSLAYGPPRRMASGHQKGAAYRSIQTWRGGTDLWPEGADYVPPHPARIATLMDDVVSFAARDDIDPVAQAAIAHGQLRSIEPFGHHNDHVARTLINGILRARRATERSVVPISAALASNSLRYNGSWRTFREGDATAMVEMVAHATIRAAEAAGHLAEHIAHLPEQWREAAHPRRGSAARALADVLPDNPVVNAQRVQDLTGASQASAYDAIARLAEAGVLTRVSPTRRDTAWAALDVFDAAQGLVSDLAGRTANTPPRPRS